MQTLQQLNKKGILLMPGDVKPQKKGDVRPRPVEPIGQRRDLLQRQIDMQRGNGPGHDGGQERISSEERAKRAEQRRNDILHGLEDRGFFERPEIKDILRRTTDPQRYEKLKEAISVELVIQELQVGNSQQFDVYRSVYISEKVPGVSTLQEWRAKNEGANAHAVYEYNGAVWKMLGEADLLVLQRPTGGSESSTIYVIAQIKAGNRDRPINAQKQMNENRAVLERFASGDPAIGIHRFQRGALPEDLTDRIERSSAADFQGQTWGPLGKKFDRELPLTAQDFQRLTNTALEQHGRDIQ